MSLATIWAKVEADAKAAVQNVLGGAEALAEQIGTEVVTEAEALLAELCDLAVGAVLAEAPKAISGQEKFGNAVTNIVQTVEAKGKAVVIADARMAVQGAYNAVKLALSAGS